MSQDSLRRKFPALESTRFQITSPATGLYTCIGFAAGDTGRVWNPDPWPDGLYYWPPVQREDTVAGWTRAFETLGYGVCESRDLEPGFEKVAIYAHVREAPQHMARQLANGLWTSKIGTMEDIEHELDGLEGDAYGKVVSVLCRRTADLGG